MSILESFYELIDLLISYGYFGSFIISFMGSLIPFLPLPYLFPIVLLSMRLDPFFIGVLSGLGGSLGKITSYIVGRFWRKFVSQNSKKNLDFFRSVIDKYGAIAVFLFALTPLPDDIVYIPMGIIGYGFLKFMMANCAGKIVLAVFVSYVGRYYKELMDMFIGESMSMLSILIAVIVMIFFSIVLFKMDWQKFVITFRQKGWRGVLTELPKLIGLSKKENV
ncbi:MAG: VTT domain-containing protein [Nitrososphaerota archaeon]|nr:VTT domain-containing protein [Aigarchaeota archaeon]MDW8076762.1 VTT domain-containing protein [Nitrososphaerota archaeon]